MRRNRNFMICSMTACLLAFASPALSLSPDNYEPDNTVDTAKRILLNPMFPEFLLPPGYEWEQIHNFYAQDDEDWVKFYVSKDQYYRIDVSSCGKDCDPVIEIYDNYKQLIMTRDDSPEGYSEYAEFLAKSDGIYYAKIRQCDTKDKFCHASYGEDTEYHLALIMPYMNFDGTVIAIIEPYDAEAAVTIADNTNAQNMIKYGDGFYAVSISGGKTYTITAKARGFETKTQTVTVKELIKTSVEINLKPCVQVSDNFSLDICAEYHAVKYGFTLMPDNPAQLSWKADLSTFRVLQSAPCNCISISDDLKLDIFAEYQGKSYGITLNYDKDAIWKMDVGTFREIQ